MNQGHINDKIIETILFIDSRESATKKYVDSRILAMYGLLETAKELLEKDILKLAVTGPQKDLGKRAFYLNAPGIKLMNEYLIAQGYKTSEKIITEPTYHSV